MPNEKRLIDANWILGEIEHDVGCYEIGNLTEDDVLYVELRDVVKMVCAAPTVDAVEVVHGHKVVRSRCRGIAYAMECPICLSKIPSNKPFTENVEYCSVCGKRLDDTFQNYCPNCGAKMDGDGDG